MGNLMKKVATAVSIIICVFSFLSCNVLHGTTGEVLQTVLNSSGTEVKMMPQHNDNKRYNMDLEKKMKEADEDRKRLEMQSLIKL